MTNRFYREVCKRLDVSEAQLRALFRIKRGDKISGGNAGQVAERKGLLTPWDATVGTRHLTAAGLALCERARQFGY